MGFHHGPAPRRLSVQRRHELLERLVGGHVPAAIPVLAPRVGDRAAFEAPLQPPQLVMGKMLEQLDRRPARRQPAAAQLAARQGLKLAHQPGPKVFEVPEEDLGARGHRNGGLGEWQAHEESMPHHCDRPRSAPNACPARRLPALKFRHVRRMDGASRRGSWPASRTVPRSVTRRLTGGRASSGSGSAASFIPGNPDRVLVLAHGYPWPDDSRLDSDLMEYARAAVRRWAAFAETHRAIVVAPVFGGLEFPRYREMLGRTIRPDEFVNLLVEQAAREHIPHFAGRF